MDKDSKSAQKDRPSTDENPSPSTNKPKTRGRKRKRRDSETSSDHEDVLPDNTLEMEKNLHSAAVKNNLDEGSVKKILKKVVTNDHVLALVKLREEEESAASEKKDMQPKITRAKAKELMRVSSKSAPWNLELTPIKHIPVKTRPEVTALIAQELPEDEDDDEYEPGNDVPSDDDQTIESCSDLDSQPRTPATPGAIISPMVVKKDGPFKVPQGLQTPARRKLIIEEEEATIALRTRSKVSLAATSIEHIENSFVPPDEVLTPVDEIWTQFLEECMNPVEVSRTEEDDEADPEYNVAADPDANDEDEEALENIIKISKKELNDLVTELFNIMPESTTDDVLAENLANNVLTNTNNNELPAHWEGKKEPISDDESKAVRAEQITQQKRDSTIRFSIGKSEPEDPEYDSSIEAAEKARVEQNLPKIAPASSAKVVNISVQESSLSVSPGPERGLPPPLRALRPPAATKLQVDIDSSATLLPEQVMVLQQQLRQHIQLAAGNFLQLFVHPTHWTLAPKYKDYLEHFNKMLEANPQSLVNVCNLKPAMELVRSWEQTVSEDTPENTKMVEFVQKQIERSRRRYRQHALYVGDFPEQFMQVVANSPVFLYPYLLPAMPYRGDTNCKFGYRKCEDAYIALGLEQFRQYLENNPTLFRRPRGVAESRSRWGLNVTCSLVCKHMLPWLAPKSLQCHIQRIRSDASTKDNPITKYFETGEVTWLKHKLLPFNPALTLYEQPEHEMPRIWVRYLAKSSKRFRDYLYKRRDSGRPPEGVPVANDLEEPTKTPLPIDFTKPIIANRVHKETVCDKFDLQVAHNNITNVNTIVNNIATSSQTNTINSRMIVINNGQIVGNLIPVNTLPVVAKTTENIPSETNTATAPVTVINSTTAVTTSTQSNCIIAQNMFRVVQTNTGAYLVPLTILQSTNTVNSINTPISSTTQSTQENTINNLVNHPNKNILEEVNKRTEELKLHCQCCLVLRRICKKKQTTITDFLTPKKEKECECRSRRYPRITKRLKWLVNNYKSRSLTEYKNIEELITKCENDKGENKTELDTDEECSFDDKVHAANFQLRLNIRAALVRNVYTKARVNNAFNKFDPRRDDPIKLAENLDQILGVDLVDMFKEFIGFLTPVQAEQMDKFKDYFVHNCVGDLAKKVEMEVSDKTKKLAILTQLKEVFADNVSMPCETCSKILVTMVDQPKLAKYVFSLFPHRSKREERDRCEKQAPLATKPPVQNQLKVSNNITETQEAVPSEEPEEEPLEDNLTICDEESLIVMDYEADHSCSEEDDHQLSGTKKKSQFRKKSISTDYNTDYVIDTPELTISKTEVEDRSDVTDEMSPLVMSEDEPVKTEPSEWRRDEDKTILEVLMQNVTPQERKDKTVLETIQEKNLYQLISDSLPNKSLTDIRDRVMYLLEILVLNTEFQ